MGFNSISNFFGQAEYESAKASKRVSLARWTCPIGFMGVWQVKIHVGDMSACLCICPQFDADGTYTTVDLYFTNELYQQIGKLCKDVTSSTLLSALLENTMQTPSTLSPLFMERTIGRRSARVTGVWIPSEDLTPGEYYAFLKDQTEPKSKSAPKKSVTDDVDDYNLSFDDL